MITAWTEHLRDPEEKQRFEDGLRHAQWLFIRLDELLSKMDRGLERQELSPRAYDNPNWQFRQAHCNGYRQCLSEIKTLMPLDHKEKK